MPYCSAATSGRRPSNHKHRIQSGASLLRFLRDGKGEQSSASRDFYKKFEEAFLEGSTLKGSAKGFLDDIKNEGDDFLKIFKDNPDFITAYEVLSGNSTLRKNQEALEKIKSYLSTPGTDWKTLKDDFDNAPDFDQYIDELGASISGVWALPPVKRGQEIERALVSNNWPPNLPFPVIDDYDISSGLVTSVKSIDLNANSYQDLIKLRNRLNGYLTKLQGFNGATLGQITVPEPGYQILGRELKIAIPKQPTPEQQAMFNDLIRKASMPTPPTPPVIITFIVYP